MPGSRALSLAELLATRLCHDLSGPLGGLAVALEEAASDPDALDLAREAAGALRWRLLLMRAAWGAPAPLQAAALHDLAAGLVNGHRLHLTLEGPLASATLPALAARLVMNAVLLAAESLPHGGTIRLGGDPGAHVAVHPAGKGAAWPVGLGAVLADPESAWAALSGGRHGVQAALTALLARDAGVPARLLLSGPADAVPPLLLDFAA